MDDTEGADQTMEDVGEKAFIADLLTRLPVHESFLNGFGDDASIIRWPGDANLVFKIDRAAGPMASRRGWAGYQLWGRLAVTSNCSDILAGGGAPLAVMIALVLPRDWPTTAAREIVEGCAGECLSNGIVFAGGDTKEGKSAELIGTAVGSCGEGAYLTRRGANPNDLVVVAGRVGGFLGAFLQFIEAIQDGRSYDDPSLSSWLEFITNPKARWREGTFVNENRLAKAAMDTSDGLFDALTVLTRGLGADIFLDHLPNHPAAIECFGALGVPLINLALGVGDWNIVYIIDPDIWSDEVKDRVHKEGLELTVIGKVTEKPGLRWIDNDNRVFDCRATINQHFSARFEDDESTLISRLQQEIHLTPIVD